MNDIQPGDDIMTLEQVASYLKLQPQTVYKWAQEGQIPGAKLGKEWRFRRRILDEWVDNSILLSKGGFKLLLDQTDLAIARKGLSQTDIEKIIEEAIR
jgi:excisionase family DNA binding protein